ncbi:MAG: hypothetical protein LBO05_14405 [Deltaproteobacteria bacterium]|nr:hypothetical protein [Deltaproteobacteria bacterium]
MTSQDQRPEPSRGEPPRCFQERDLAVLDSASRMAFELVSEACGPDFFDVGRVPVDVRHFPQLLDSEKRGGVLAQLLCYSRTHSVTRGRPAYWRVCLYDPAILKTCLREKLDLLPLLSYVLTHELVHVSRFSKFLELFGLDEAARFREEVIVHRQTADLMETLSLPGMDGVLTLFREHPRTLD